MSWTMSAHPREVHKRRATITALPLYYFGHLLKKCKHEKDFKKYYGELRGTTLFLYNDDTQDTYTERFDLEELKSVKIDSSYLRKASILTLKLPTTKVQLQTDNPDTGEEWKRHILTVRKKEIPSKSQLLPGQILQLQEVLDQEKRRTLPMSHPVLPPKPAFLLPASSSTHIPPPPPRDMLDSTPEVPACFFDVTRKEAERMLEENPEYGSMILRPSTLANSSAVTFRLLTPRGPVMKNFRVTSTNSGFVIEMDPPVFVPSLNAVIEYFLELTEYRLRPYMSSQPYDTHMGESNTAVTSSVSLGDNDTSPSGLFDYVTFILPAPKRPPKAQVAPMLRSESKERPPLPPKPMEDEYEVPADERSDEHSDTQVSLKVELLEALKKRREAIYTASNEEENTTYENNSSEKSHSSTAQWNTGSFEFDC